MDLAVAMAAFYPDEATRTESIRTVLEAHEVHFNVTKTKTTGYKTDGDISTRGYHFMLAEFKNEAGSCSGEPYFQIIGYYLKSTRLQAPKMVNSPLSCLLLSIFGPFFFLKSQQCCTLTIFSVGPYIVFASATWNRRPTAQMLSMPLTFHIHSGDTYNFSILA